ncbi:ABC transporter permease [Marinomonas foliarum]|uniref:Monosaccharide ABC transporter membrane protein (CUT2 family) n=1 Tax=Marinomonas foliarum TaxID=491950 RepID=A0A369AHB8_9GAMM|nr:ABC transporter permease [Marinomonas foliarum]RCX08750.1 monosaccharide ABC transporter membrane protein (CUT2 family) [Marinomonas foliarum]
MRKYIDILTRRNTRQGAWGFPLLVFLGICVWLSFNTARFATIENAENLIAQAMPLIIVAIGQMLVVLVGGLDLSVGAVISFTTAILSLDAPTIVLLPVVFVLAALVGLMNGLVVTRCNVHPIIATLAMQYMLLGATRLIRPVSGGEIPQLVLDSVSGEFFGIPFPVFWGIVVVLIAWKLLYRSRYGLHLFAIGGGMASGQTDAAHNFGIAVRRNIVLAYVGSACFATIAGIFLAGRITSGDPNVGLLFELDSITAVALGGTQLSGGVGSLQGTVIGALVLALMSNGMNLVNLSPFVQTVVKGGILLIVVGLQSRKKMGL